MPELPINALRAAEFLVRRLYRPIDEMAGSPQFAVAETEGLDDDRWFWNDDNAKVLELMSRPEVWRRFPEETAEILRFVRSMCDGPFIFRRLSAPRLDLIGTEGTITTYRHSLMGLRYDLARGAIVAGVRFHDERNTDNLMLSGNYVEFTYRGRRFRRQVTAAGEKTSAVRDGHMLRLSHASEIHAAIGWSRRRIGVATYTYIFDARSMLFEVEAAFDPDPSVELRDVVLTIGHDGLAYCFFNNIVTDAASDGAPLFAAGKPGQRLIPAADASYYAIRQGHISSDALAIHSLPRAPERLRGFDIAVDIAGRLSRVRARYEFPGRHRGGRLVAAEHKLVTAGGFYNRVSDYAVFVRKAAAASPPPCTAQDYSISYDYGVTINAFAKCFAVANSGGVPTDPPSLPEELRALVDTNLRHYFELYVDRHERQPNVIFSRELAFVTLGVMTMYRATGADEYRRRLTRLCDILLDFEMRFDDPNGLPISGFLMRKDSPRAAYVDCHSGVLLALTQAARYVADPRLAPAIDCGLRSYGLETCRFPGGLVDTVQTIMFDEQGRPGTANAFWNFKVGLTLRFFAALRAAEEPALRAVAARHRDRMNLLETVMRRQLENSTADHEDGVEISCSVQSAGTNSESQPWAVLGLVGHPFD
ncbi:MAG: hypothetical protein AB7H90_22215 [Alphaproteobacteria bacterium]